MINCLICSEKCLNRNPPLEQMYGKFVQKYLAMRHMVVIPASQLFSSPTYYIPHHCANKLENLTTKELMPHQKIKSHQNFQCTVCCCCLKTVTYRVSLSQYLATRTLQQSTEDEKDKFPVATSVLRQMFMFMMSQGLLCQVSLNPPTGIDLLTSPKNMALFHATTFING
ncbi:hypothetical protein PR048_027830 [Dryococelus australis]|uniref:Uncharacterized protein n=1 Tax=Dryococelus australis TaxID=614101 RepID=A0ABQ9GHL6_9NEOP|nr:hypothetical protein PR048_027830 [Dryococelus australis]